MLLVRKKRCCARALAAASGKIATVSPSDMRGEGSRICAYRIGAGGRRRGCFLLQMDARRGGKHFFRRGLMSNPGFIDPGPRSIPSSDPFLPRETIRVFVILINLHLGHFPSTHGEEPNETTREISPCCAPHGEKLISDNKHDVARVRPH